MSLRREDLRMQQALTWSCWSFTSTELPWFLCFLLEWLDQAEDALLGLVSFLSVPWPEASGRVPPQITWMCECNQLVHPSPLRQALTALICERDWLGREPRLD